jgi:hypothetical protein
MIVTEMASEALNAARKQPFLVLTIALLLLAGSIIGLAWLTGSTQPISIRIRLAPIALDLDANSPDALVRAIAPDAESRQAGILSQTFIQDAIGKDGGPKTRMAAAAIGLDAKVRDSSALVAEALLDKLEVDVDRYPDGIEIMFHAANASAAVETLQTIAVAYAAKQKQVRRRQKNDALDWIDRHSAGQQTRIDDAKAAIVNSPLDSDLSRLTPQTESETLLRLLIDATKDARSSESRGLPERGNEADTRQGGTGLAERNYASLTVDIERMTATLDQVEQAHAEQKRFIAELEDAQSDLARFEEQVAALMATGLLDGPAAEVMTPQAIKMSALSPWLQRGLSLLLLAGLSLALATAIVMVIDRKRRNSGEADGSEFLNDPNWPRPVVMQPNDQPSG